MQRQGVKSNGVMWMGKYEQLQTAEGKISSSIENADTKTRDKLSDYLDVNSASGELKVYRNADKSSSAYGWSFQPLGVTASGLGPGRNVRFADIDGDGVSSSRCFQPSTELAANTLPLSLTTISISRKMAARLSTEAYLRTPPTNGWPCQKLMPRVSGNGPKRFS